MGQHRYYNKDVKQYCKFGSNLKCTINGSMMFSVSFTFPPKVVLHK